MKKIGILTIYDNTNCGNRLQNYALQEILKKLNFDVYTLKNNKLLNDYENYFINLLKFCKRSIVEYIKRNRLQHNAYKKFNKNIKFYKKYVTCKTKNLNKKFDYFIVGSDQVWKPTRMRMSYMDLLGFAKPEQKIAYASSFGIEKIEEMYFDKLRKGLENFKHVSVREDAGARIIKEVTGRTDAHVVLDPTMLIDRKDWEILEERPNNIENKKIILTYFLGDNIYEEELKRKYKEDEYQIIHFLNSKNSFGPQQFLYLINHAELVLTDSFHACVFSILFNTSFYVFNRQQKATNNNMNSRLDTLLSTFEINDRKIDDIKDIGITSINYKKVEKILKEKRKLSLNFLKNALNIKDSD